jgi:DNA modification methylase
MIMTTRDTTVAEAFGAGYAWPAIEWLPTTTPQTNPKNARKHSRKQIRKIADSIKQCGFLNAIILDDNNVVLAGHGRLAAARLLNLRQVPVLRFSHLNDAQKRAYVIADNKIAEEAGWNRDLLAIELGELIELLPAHGFDIALTGFDVGEIDLLFADMANAKAESQDILTEPPRQPVSRIGDLWQLGKHRLMCGDARDFNNFARLMQEAKAAAAFIDPPYNRDARAIGGRGQIRHKNFAFASGEMSPAQFRRFLRRTLGNAVAVSAPGAVHFNCMDWRGIADLISIGSSLYGTMLNLVVWNKTNAGQGSLYRSQHELIGVFRVGDQAHRNNVELGRFGRNRSNVWTYPGVNSFGRGRMQTLASHPTVKPVALVADALLDCTARGDIVLDPFAGSGTIVLAAEKIGRVARGIEYEPGYIDVAIKRWQDITKLDAMLVDDGRSFAEIAEERGHG